MPRHHLSLALVLALLGAAPTSAAEDVEREILPGSPAPQAAVPATKPTPPRGDLRLWVAAGLAALPSLQRKAPPRREAPQRGFRVEE